jgi:hypothetical protein
MRSKSFVFCAAALGTLLVCAPHARAAHLQGTLTDDVLIGPDDDRVDDPEIQPNPAAANQSLDRADTLIGLNGDDVLIGMGGSDTLVGDFGDDIMIGGNDSGAPNSDIQIGGSGNDVAIWQGGDGSDHFDGGVGGRDALVFATMDTDPNTGIPILSPVTGRHRQTGLPTADATGQGGFCRLEAVADPAARGFEFLVRFFSRSSGALLVTVRTRDVEQVYCTSEAGGAITFADLTVPDPTFVEVSLDQVDALNSTVAKIIR